MKPSTTKKMLVNLIIIGDLKFPAPLLANSPGGEKGKENALVKKQSLKKGGVGASEGKKMENQALYKKEEKVPDSFAVSPAEGIKNPKKRC